MSLWPRLFALAAVAGASAVPALAGGDEEVEPPLRTLTNSVGMKFVLVPKGTFLMGAPKEDKEAADDERPQHEVEITRPFYLGVHEVTQRQWQEVMGSNPSHFSKAGGKAGAVAVNGLDTDNFPVESVSWHDAQDFVARLNALPAEKKAGRTHRLPTEAEWEYACRAGSKTRFGHGDEIAAKDANQGGNLQRTCKVGSYKPNRWGLYDMHGNVWEWVSDYSSTRYYRESPLRDPPGPAAGDSRVHRGGSFKSKASECRSSYRSWSSPGVRDERFGLRVALAVPK